MKSASEVCLITLARINSSRCPFKMSRRFANTTLLDIVLAKMSSTTTLRAENKYVSLYDKELIEIAKNYQVNLHARSHESANTESSLVVMYDFWDILPFKYAVLINPCNPLVTAATIDNFINTFLESSFENLFAVHETKNFYWNSSKEPITPWPDGSNIMNTKLLPKTYAASHCLYAGRLDTIKDEIWMSKAPWIVDSPKLFVMPVEEVIDIDYEWEFNAAEAIYQSRYMAD